VHALDRKPVLLASEREHDQLSFLCLIQHLFFLEGLSCP
jgi:hypothetical protein